MDARSHREIPSARVFFTPFTCRARKHHPLRTSSHPSIRINAPDLGSLPARHWLIQCIADWLSPRIRILWRSYSGFAPACTTKAHAVTTMPSNSSTFIDRSSLPHTRCRRRLRTPSSKSILHHAPDSRQYPPIASPDASDQRVRTGGCRKKNYTRVRVMHPFCSAVRLLRAAART